MKLTIILSTIPFLMFSQRVSRAGAMAAASVDSTYTRGMCRGQGLGPGGGEHRGQCCRGMMGLGRCGKHGQGLMFGQHLHGRNEVTTAGHGENCGKQGSSTAHNDKGAPTKLLKKTTLVQGDATKNRLSVHTLTFAIPPRDQVQRHGRRALPHEQVAMDLGDSIKMVIPDHRPTPYSMNALRDNEFDITFKVYPNGRASGYLDRLKVGDEIRSFGRWEGRMRNPGKYVGIIAYGVGITEALPVAEAELKKGDAEQVVLLWSSRTKADTFWEDRILAMEHAYPRQFRMVYSFSREEQDGCLHGRVNPNVIEQVFRPTNPKDARFHFVGTPEMMDLTRNMFTKVGYTMPANELLPHHF